MEKNEVESYVDVKEYLIAKGLYERVLEIDWKTYEEDTFSDLFTWSKTKEGHNFWSIIDYELFELEIQDRIESLVQDYKAKQDKEFVEYIEAQPEEVVETKPTSYINVKEYLIAKGLYERVLNQKWRPLENGRTCTPFSFLFNWINTIDGITYWNTVDKELRALGIHTKVESLIKDYKAKQDKEFIKHLEAQPEEVVETNPLEKPKQYLCYVQGKSLPKHIHKTLEQAKQEAQRLCRKELAKVRVLEVVAEYEAEVLVKEVL